MADNKETTTFKIDLDSKAFVESAIHAKESIENLADASSLTGLVNGLLKIGPALAVVAATAYTMKKAFDLTLEAESIERVEKQFNIMTKSAGMNGEVFKTSLEKAAAGLVDTNDLLSIANKGFIVLGNSVGRLPEIIEIARKATQVYGGDVEENIERITQAMGMQQTRALKQIGITVDTDKAYRDYARSLGVTVAQLSEAGKQQAFINQALESGKGKYKDVAVQTDTLTMSLKKAKIAWTEAYEAFSLWVKDSYVSTFFKKWADNFEVIGTKIARVFGKDTRTEVEKNEEKINSLREKWLDLDKTIDDVGNRAKYRTGEFAYLFKQEDIDAQKEKIQSRYKVEQAAIMEQIKGLQGINTEKEKAAQLEKEEAATKTVKSTEPLVNLQKVKEDNAKFNKEIVDMQASRQQKEMDMIDTQEGMKKAQKDRELTIEKQYHAEIEVLNTRQDITDKQRAILEEQATQDKFVRLKELKLQQEKEMADADNRMVENSKNSARGFSNAITAEARKANREMGTFANAGKVAFHSFQSNATSALEAWGAGTKTASEAARGFFFGMLGDMASASGQYMMLDAFKGGLGMINYPELAAGAGLVALSGALKSMASGSSLSGSESSGGGGGGVGSAAVSPTTTPTLDQSTAMKKTVTVNIAGNYFDTETTRRAMLEMIRQETDATDFRYQQVKV